MTTSPRFQDAELPTSGPWWRHPMMWLIVGGPSVVVVAGIATLMLAIIYPDPVVVSAAAKDPDSVARPVPVAGPGNAKHVPAMTARNHAATGGQAP